MFLRILNKLRRESYKLFRPILWGRSLQINGIPTIGNIAIRIKRHIIP